MIRQGIHRYHICDFLTNCSKVIDQNSNFSYLMTRRWRCSQLWHGTSNHASNEAYQFSFWLIKLWPRYSLWTNFGSTSLSLRHNFWTKMNKKNLFSHFCAAQSKDHLSKIWTKLDKFRRRSSEKTEYCTFQNGYYCSGRSLNVRYWLWSAWWEESGVLSFISQNQRVQKL